MVAAGRAAGQLPGDEAEVAFFRDVSRGIADTLVGNADAGRGSLRRALAAPLDLTDPRWGTWAGAAALYLGDLTLAMNLYARTGERARRQGAVGILPYYLEFEALAALLRGQLGVAEGIADEGLRLRRRRAGRRPRRRTRRAPRSRSSRGTGPR